MNKEYIFYIVVYALDVLSKYFINKKAGIKGWYALIPFYSDYLLYKYANAKKYYLVMLFTNIIGSVIFIFTAFVGFMLFIAHTTSQDYIEYVMLDHTTVTIPIASITKVVVIALIISLIILGISWHSRFKMCKGLALNFNATKGFAWLIFFLSIIAQLILAFDQEYIYLPLHTLQENPTENN